VLGEQPGGTSSEPARDIPVVPPPPFTLRFLYGVAIAFSVFVGVLYFRSIPGLTADKAGEQLRGAFGIIAIALVLVAIIVAAVHRRSLRLSKSALTLRAGFYKRTLPRASLKVDAGVVGSLFDQRAYAPRWRTNGIRVPGFQAGWFRLVNGEKAFVLLTDPRVVTYLPTTAGYALVVSTSELLRALSSDATDTATGQG
jgi:hypothetical protein